MAEGSKSFQEETRNTRILIWKNENVRIALRFWIQGTYEWLEKWLRIDQVWSVINHHSHKSDISRTRRSGELHWNQYTKLEICYSACIYRIKAYRYQERSLTLHPFYLQIMRRFQISVVSLFSCQLYVLIFLRQFPINLPLNYRRRLPVYPYLVVGHESKASHWWEELCRYLKQLKECMAAILSLQ